MEAQFLPSMSLLLILVMVTSFQAPISVFGQEDKYQNCSTPFQCGNITEIGYPFWGSSRPSYCGHPDFQLTCSDQNATITISELNYQVLQIMSSSRTLTLARTDYLTTICPNYLHDTNINASHFSYPSGIVNVAIYYYCRTVVSGTYATALGLSAPIACTMNTTSVSTGYYTVGNLTENLGAAIATPIYAVLETCSQSVIIPANQSIAQSSLNVVMPTADKLVEVLDQGFGLVWDADGTDETCNTCISRGGACGYNQTTNSFACYCPDQGCKSGKGSNVSVPIGLSIAGAVIVGIVLGCWLLIIRKRRKTKAPAQTQSMELLSPSPINKNVHTPASDLSLSIPPYPYPNSKSKSDLEKGSTYFGVQVFSFTELEEATDNFDPSKELGSGGFGTVYYGILRDGRSVAVKRLFDNGGRRTEQFMNEVEILNRLRHKNLVQLYGCTSRRSKELILVYEYIPNKTVADHLQRGESNSSLLMWPVRMSIAIETADALAYLHASDVIHRDVKTNNILLDNKFHVKVADFGLSRLFPNNVTHVSTSPQGTPGYVDPEYYRTYQLTDKSDVYSFGVVLIELMSSLPAVDTKRNRQDVNLASMAICKIQNHSLIELVDPDLGFDKDPEVRKMATSVAELAFRCLQQDRDMRPTMNEVLQALKKIESENYPVQKAEALDIGEDDARLLKQVSPMLSPDSVVQDKWVSSSSPGSF